MGFVTFRHKSTGELRDYPEHYKDIPQFAKDLEVYNPDGHEEDKVVVEDHRLPVEQRVTKKAEKVLDAPNSEEEKENK